MVAAHDRSRLFVWWRTRKPTNGGWFAALAVVFAVAAATLPPASPASAAIPGWQVISDQSEISSREKHTSARCPSNKVAIGGGYRIVNGQGQVDVKRLSMGRSLVGVDAYEDPTGYPKDWYIITYAVCADPPPGLETVFARSSSGSASTRGVSVTCPPGKRVVGAGFDTQYATRQLLDDNVIRIASLVPDSTLTSVHASAYEARPTSNNWDFVVEATCADGPAAVGLQLVSAFSASDDRAVKSAFAACPTGKRAIGVGGWLSGGGTGRILEALDPFSGTGVAADAREDEVGYPSAWSVTSHAICAPA